MMGEMRKVTIKADVGLAGGSPDAERFPHAEPLPGRVGRLHSGEKRGVFAKRVTLRPDL